MNSPNRFPVPLILRALLVVALPAAPAFAADGVVEINQARALAGGVSVVDEPGFPVTLGRPGSYMLTGDLMVNSADTTAIDIRALNVDLNLNGFAIDGPVDCGPPDTPTTSCSASSGGAEGWGVKIRDKGATVRNGSITGMGKGGIEVLRPGATISAVRVIGNAGWGISAGVDSPLFSATGLMVVEDSLIQQNESFGIIGCGFLVRNSVVTRNGSQGIINTNQCGSSVIDSQVTANGGAGVVCHDCLIRGNVVARNVGPGIVSGGGLILNNFVSTNANPQVDMRLSLSGVAWGGNHLIRPGSPPHMLFEEPGPDPPMVLRELTPNSCNGVECRQPTPL